jgi:hypothetical protein
LGLSAWPDVDNDEIDERKAKVLGHLQQRLPEGGDVLGGNQIVMALVIERHSRVIDPDSLRPWPHDHRHERGPLDVRPIRMLGGWLWH